MGCATSPSRARLLLALLMVAGLALRLWGIDYGLPHPMVRPDEEVLVPRLVTFDAGDPNPHWFMYPTLSLYLTYAWVKSVLVAGHVTGLWAGATDIATLVRTDPRPVYLLARVLSALLGTATIGATYLLGRLLGGWRAGLIAALLVTVSFLHVRESHFFKPDAVLSLFLTTALAACVVLQRRGTRAAAVLAGVACGLALSVKYTLTLAVPPVLAAGLGPVGGERPSRVARVGLAAVAAGAAAFAGSPYVFLAWDEFVGWVRVARMWVQYGGEGFGTGFVYHLRHSFLAAQGMPLTLFALASLAWQLPVRSGLPVTAFLVVSLLQLGLASAAYTRYVTPFLPALYAVVGVACVRLVDRVSQRGPARLAVTTVLLLLLVARPLHSAIRFDQIAAAPDTRLQTTAWVTAHVPAGTPILLLGAPWPYTFGDPELPGYTVRRNPTLDLGVRWVVTHEHPVPFSRLPDEFERLRPELQLVQTFSPFVDSTVPPEALFELRDAFYVPVAGFGNVVRGGPLVHVYRVKRAGDETDGAS